MKQGTDSSTLAVIYKILTEGFDDTGLDTFCMLYFEKVYAKFGRGQRKDEKANLLLDHCRRRNLSDFMLDALHKFDAELFAQYEPLITSAPLVTGVVFGTDPIVLASELGEWKLIHNETQELLNALSTPLEYLTAYRFSGDPERLDDAGFKWQESCVPKLRLIPTRWTFQYAHTDELEHLRTQASRVDEITRRLMQTDIQRAEFKLMVAQLVDLKGTLWDILTAADKRIMVLVDALKLVIGE